MAEMKEVQKKAQQRQEVAQCDTFTVIEGARTDLYNPKSNSEPSPWIEEALERFDHQLRAGLGSQQLVPAGSTGSGSS